MTANLLTLDEARALIKAAEFVQHEKHELGLHAASCEASGDFEGVNAYRYATRCLQRVEDKLRNAAKPVPASDPYAWRSRVRE